MGIRYAKRSFCSKEDALTKDWATITGSLRAVAMGPFGVFHLAPPLWVWTPRELHERRAIPDVNLSGYVPPVLAGK